MKSEGVQFKRLESTSPPRALNARPPDVCLDAIASAVTWMASLGLDELEGDDAVGWWVLLEYGHRLPLARGETMQKQLSGLLPRIQIGKSATYTATAIARTLARSGNLVDLERVQRAFLNCLDEAVTSVRTHGPAKPYPRDVVWLVQAIYELGAFESAPKTRSFSRLIKTFLLCNLWGCLMILPFLEIVLSPKDWRPFERKMRPKIKAVVAELGGETRLHWEVSYLLLACIRLKMRSEAKLIVQFFLHVQRDNQWDEGTDENIESTALVALALGEFWQVYGETPPHYQRRIVTLAVADRLSNQESLEEAWQAVLRASRATRGKALESFIAKYCRDDENLKVEECNYRTESEELDLVLSNQARNVFFKQLQSSRIVVECKCRKKKTSAADVRNFCSKIRNRSRVLHKVGVIVSTGGFTKEAKIEIARNNARENDPLIGLVTAEQMSRAIMSGAPFCQVVERSLASSALR